MGLPELYLQELERDMAQAEKLLTYIKQVASSNLFWSIDDNDCLFCGFPQSLQANSGTTP
jgi:hypothetical protein